MDRIRLDLNNPEFQRQWLEELDRETATEVLAAFKKLHQLDWQALYRHSGMRWEAVHSKTGPSGRRIHSFRITKKVRALAYREGDFLRMLSLHQDHDSAYH